MLQPLVMADLAYYVDLSWKGFNRSPAVRTNFVKMAWLKKKSFPYLWSFCLNPPHTPWAVDDCVLWDDFAGVHLTEGSNDTATGEDHIPSNVSYTTKQNMFHTLITLYHLNTSFLLAKKTFVCFPPFDSITLLSPIFRAWDTVRGQLRPFIVGSCCIY